MGRISVGGHMKHYRIAAFCALSALALSAQPAHAATNCTLSVQRVTSGDDGYVYIYFTNGGLAAIYPTDPDKELTVSLAMTALVSSRQVGVRFTADGIACNLSRWDMEHFSLL